MPFLKLARRWSNSPETAEWFAQHFPRMVGNTPERRVDPMVLWGHFRSRLGIPKNGLFRGLDETSVRSLVAESTLLRCRAGESLMRHGQVADDLMVVLSGKVGVHRDGSNDEAATDDVARPGDVLGVGSFLQGESRSCDATTLEYTEILSITPAAMKRALRRTSACLRRARENLESMEQQRVAASKRMARRRSA